MDPGSPPHRAELGFAPSGKTEELDEAGLIETRTDEREMSCRNIYPQ
jgi:hypothetical protein